MGYLYKKDSKSESSTGFTCYMDTIVRASSFEEKIKKILIPFNTSDKRKKQLSKKGYIIETFFGNDSEIKKKALEKKMKFCLFKNSIISIKK